MKYGIRDMKHPTLANFRHYRHLRSIWICSIITYFQTHSILKNKANFRDAKMNINSCLTMNYVILCHWLRRKNKPNSNPIKPKTNPIKANTNPIQTQTNPILKMLEFTLDVSSLAFLSGAWVRTFTIVLIMLLADFTTLKGVVER